MANRIDLANKAEVDALRLELRNALNGFSVLPYRISDGPPTDAPEDGHLPTIDTTNNRLYIRTNGAWRYSELGDADLGLTAEQLATLASVASKADQSAVDDALALKANQDDVTAALATKVNSSTYTAGLATKADQTALDTALTFKADLIDGKVPAAQIPAIAISDVTTVDSEAAMLALTAEVGDVAKRTDLDGAPPFMLAAEPASTLANWTRLVGDFATTVELAAEVSARDAGDADTLAAAAADATAKADAVALTSEQEAAIALVPEKVDKVGMPLNPMWPAYGAKGNGEDDTAAINAWLADLKFAESGYLPDKEFSVTNLVLNYDDETAQVDSGYPFGYRGTTIRGAGKRRSKITQINGTPGDVLTIRGKIGTDSGPGHNNKIAGMTLSDLEIRGNGAGGHGLHFRSLVDFNCSDVFVSGCGGSGVYFARDHFVSGEDDEYMYAINLTRVKAVANGRYGFETSGVNSISGNFFACDATGNTLGGGSLNVTNLSIFGSGFIGNASGNAAGFGLRIYRNSNLASTNNTALVVGCRFESNSAPGGYDLKIDGGLGNAIVDPTFFSTSGSHCIGIGTNAQGNEYFVRSPLISGGYFGGAKTVTTQKAIVLGSDCREALILNPRFDYALFNNGAGITPNSLITDGGANTSLIHNQNLLFAPEGDVRFIRKIGSPGAAPANSMRMYIKDDGTGKTAMVLRFPSGNEQFVGAEGGGVQNKGGNYTALPSDTLIVATATATITLPTTFTAAGKRIDIFNSGTGTVTAAAATGSVIGAAANSVQNTSKGYIFNGTDWYAVS